MLYFRILFEICACVYMCVCVCVCVCSMFCVCVCLCTCMQGIPYSVVAWRPATLLGCEHTILATIKTTNTTYV